MLPSAEDILSRKRNDEAIIVASSEEIKDEEPNPPHYEAKTEYKKRLKKKSNFLNTAVHSVKDEIPQPIVLVVSDAGIQDVSAVIEEKEARGFAEALKTGALEAAISICSPVRGLRATRAGRLRTSKEPKPTT